MRSLRALAPLLAAVFLTGCGYIHFGRLPLNRSGDAALQEAYSNLSLEHKILKQELELSRKENDSLRSALDRAGGSSSGSATELARQLEKTTQELATVRSNFAKLQAERRPAADAALNLAATEAVALREENTRLRRDLDASRQENAALAEKLKTSVSENEQAQASLTQLNTELVDQKQARDRAEQANFALRAQLEAVMARAGRAESTPSTPAAESAAPPSSAPMVGPQTNPLAALQGAKAPPSGSVPSVELRTNPERAHAAASAAMVNPPDAGPAPAPIPPTSSQSSATASDGRPQGSGAAATPPPATHSYTVQPGDTLERIAVKEYGAADQWGKIYAANAEALGSGQGLKPGMTLQIPEK